MLCTEKGKRGGLGSPRRWRSLISLDCDAAAGLLVATEAQVAADRRELALVNDTVPVGAILFGGDQSAAAAGEFNLDDPRIFALRCLSAADDALGRRPHMLVGRRVVGGRQNAPAIF